jgi:hypothetical protein
MHPTAQSVEQDTRRWLERAVIGLNLCPFAKAVHVKGQVHFAVSEASNESELLEDFARELDELVARDPLERDTTLVIAANCLQDFFAFNAFLGVAERLIRKRKLEGVIQLASFHPLYQFVDSEDDDITNFTNRSPYPILHLLREESVARAVAAFPDAQAVYEANKKTLRQLGKKGWEALGVGPST